MMIECGICLNRIKRFKLQKVSRGETLNSWSYFILHPLIRLGWLPD